MRTVKKFTSLLLGLFMLLLSIGGISCVAYAQKEGEELKLYAQAAVLMDGDSGRVLYGKNETEVRAMASTTKIMTCILVLENTDLDGIAEVSSRAAGQPKVHLGVSAGEQFYVKDLLYSLMLESHNDAAVILAEKTAGSVEAFAKMMNEKAAELGCMDTHFVTPNGLDGEDEGGEHATTATDLGRILCYCIRQSPMRDKFLEITRTDAYSFFDVSGNHSYSCVNHNAFLSMMEGALTGKTGFTGKAGYCYVGALESEGRTFVVVLLGCGWPNNRNYKWQDTRKLMDYGMEHYHLCDVNFVQVTEPILVKNGIPESGRRTDACYVPTCVDAGENSAIQILASSDDQIKMICRMKKSLPAPAKAGMEAGEMKIYLNGEEIGRRPVVTTRGAGEITYPWCISKIIDRFCNHSG